VSRDAKPSDDLLIQEKDQYTELLIDRMAALYNVDGQIKDENVERVINQWYWSIPG